MTASVEILTNRKVDVLSVPLSAVTTRGEDDKKEGDAAPQNGPPNNNQQNNNSQQKPAEKKKDKVVVFVNEGGTAKMVEVKTGISDYDNIEILSGLSDSAQVVTGPFLVVSKRLKDGERISTPKPEAKKDQKPSEEKK